MRLFPFLLIIPAALLPLVWVARHTGAKRDRSREGTLDGFLLLGSILLGLAALWFVGVALVRESWEHQITTHWRVLDAQLVTCSRAELGAGVRDRARAYALTCQVAYVDSRRAKQAQLRVGYPSRAGIVNAWMRAHPEGSPVTLYQNPENPAELWGLARRSAVVTNDAAGARRLGAKLALVCAMLFLLSRAVVAHRGRHGMHGTA